MVTRMIISEDVKDIKKLSTKSKRMITIKKLSNLLLKEEPIIKVGPLYKQSDNLNKSMMMYIYFPL